MTHYVGAVSGVNKDLVVGVGLSLHLLGAMSSWGLTFAKGRKDKVESRSNSCLLQIRATTCVWCSLQLEIRALPVRHGRGDVSVIEPGMPREQDNASVAKHTVEKQLRGAQQQREMG